MEVMIAEKISRLREYLGYLREMRESSLQTYISDYRIRGATERYLHLAIESVIDVGNEIISKKQLSRPERYRDIPTILAENQIITEELEDLPDDRL